MFFLFVRYKENVIKEHKIIIIVTCSMSLIAFISLSGIKYFVFNAGQMKHIKSNHELKLFSWNDAFYEWQNKLKWMNMCIGEWSWSTTEDQRMVIAQYSF